MEISDYISALALLISLISLLVSGYVAMRDRAKIQATCKAYKNWQTDEYSYISIRAVNKGRRPITLLYLTGVYHTNEIIQTCIGAKGIKLDEGEYYDENIGKFDGTMMYVYHEEGTVLELQDLMITDVTGKNYKISNAKNAIKQVRDSKHDFGTRTHHEA